MTLSTTTTGATIYYTLDGTTPTTTSAVYSDAISLPTSIIPTSTTIKMFASSNDCLNSDVAEYTYTLYTAGPAGGYVFYDCDADNDETNDGAGPDNLKSTTCGWRYLEAAPSDVSASSIFGYCRPSAQYLNGLSYYVAGTSDPDDGNSTGTAVGTGQANTTKLVKKMGSYAYLYFWEEDDSTTSNYAAKLCDDYTGGGCSDWFLPSKDELNLMYKNLKQNGIGGFVSTTPYWSSSEYNNFYNFYFGLTQDFNNGSQLIHYRDECYRVRAIRSF